MLQMLVQNLQLLYHNHQQQVDMENYMNYMLGHEQKGSHGNIAAGLLFFAAFGVFWRKLQRHLQSRHMYYSISSGLFEQTR